MTKSKLIELIEQTLVDNTPEGELPSINLYQTWEGLTTSPIEDYYGTLFCALDVDGNYYFSWTDDADFNPEEAGIEDTSKQLVELEELPFTELAFIYYLLLTNTYEEK